MLAYFANVGKNLEAACKSYAYREFHMAEKLADKLAEEIMAMGGMKAAPKEKVDEFVAASVRAEELRHRFVPDTK